MPKIGYSKEALEDKPAVPDGMYEVRLDGFKPEVSSGGDSYNFKPVLVVVNHPTENDKRVWLNLNSKPGAAFIMKAFLHCFGLDFDQDGNIPGQFAGGDDPNPTGDTNTVKARNEIVHAWKYEGPLMYRTGRVRIGTIPASGQYKEKKGSVVQLYCQVTNCKDRHPENLS